MGDNLLLEEIEKVSCSGVIAFICIFGIVILSQVSVGGSVVDIVPFDMSICSE